MVMYDIIDISSLPRPPPDSLNLGHVLINWAA